MSRVIEKQCIEKLLFTLAYHAYSYMGISEGILSHILVRDTHMHGTSRAYMELFGVPYAYGCPIAIIGMVTASDAKY